jgi:hypothetical protein
MGKSMGIKVGDWVTAVTDGFMGGKKEVQGYVAHDAGGMLSIRPVMVDGEPTLHPDTTLEYVWSNEVSSNKDTHQDALMDAIDFSLAIGDKRWFKQLSKRYNKMCEELVK